MGITRALHGLRGPVRGVIRWASGRFALRRSDRKERSCWSCWRKRGEIFPEQVTTNSLTQNLVYALGTVGAPAVVAGLVMLDAASVRRLNVFNSTIEKLVGFFIGFAVYFLIGFAIWNWQYNEAFEVAEPARAVDRGLVARRNAGQ